jgi:hypothetical protein
VSGELSRTSAFRIAAGTLPASDGGDSPHRHNLMIYFPDMYDQAAAKEVEPFQHQSVLDGIMLIFSPLDSDCIVSTPWIEGDWRKTRLVFGHWYETVLF